MRKSPIIEMHAFCIIPTGHILPHRYRAMPSLQIRDLSDNLYHALSLRARREHRSLTQQAVVELERTPTLTAGKRRRTVVAHIQATLRGPDGALSPTPEALVREDRER